MHFDRFYDEQPYAGNIDLVRIILKKPQAYFYFLPRRCLMSILADFYTPNIITDPKYKLSPSGVYYAPPKAKYEDYIDFIKVWPL